VLSVELKVAAPVPVMEEDSAALLQVRVPVLAVAPLAPVALVVLASGLLVALVALSVLALGLVDLLPLVVLGQLVAPSVSGLLLALVELAESGLRFVAQAVLGLLLVALFALELFGLLGLVR